MDEKIIKRLVKAAKPFTSGDVVDETDGTIPLMEELEEAIAEIESQINNQ